ncbi:TadE/TadG family type IV pilus assembly protein [Blautia sp.]|uniref:TadE/TadG family type IV pilus assembly protein n=1 Tax=Blautia sp. TaxID=1955243 RepID=UPI003AB1581F
MKKERQKGSITVEASLFIPMFLFAFMSIYSLVFFVRAQLVIQYAADQAAKEVAQYSYILEKTGILDSYQNLGQEASDFSQEMEKIKENLSELDSAAQKIAAGQGTAQDMTGAGQAGQGIYDTVENYARNPEEFINGALGSIKISAWDGLSSYMVGTVAESCVVQQLATASGTEDVEAYLKSLGVSGLSYKNSSWCRNGSNDIKIVVDYDVKSHFPFFDLPSKHYRVCASTRVWSGI